MLVFRIVAPWDTIVRQKGLEVWGWDTWKT